MTYNRKQLRYASICIAYIIVSLIDWHFNISGLHSLGFVPEVYALGACSTYISVESCPLLLDLINFDFTDIPTMERTIPIEGHNSAYHFINDCVKYNSIVVNDKLILNDLATHCILSSLGYLLSGISLSEIKDVNVSKTFLDAKVENSEKSIHINSTLVEAGVVPKLNEDERQEAANFDHHRITKIWYNNLEIHEQHNYLIYNKGVYVFKRFMEDHPTINVDNYALLLTLCNNNAAMGRWFRLINEEFVTIATTPEWLKEDTLLYTAWSDKYIKSIQLHTLNMSKFRDKEDILRNTYKEALEKVHSEKEIFLNQYVLENPAVAIDKITAASLPVEMASKHLGKGSKELSVALSKELSSYKRNLLRKINSNEMSPIELQSLLEATR